MVCGSALRVVGRDPLPALGVQRRILERLRVRRDERAATAAQPALGPVGLEVLDQVPRQRDVRDVAHPQAEQQVEVLAQLMRTARRVVPHLSYTTLVRSLRYFA